MIENNIQKNILKRISGREKELPKPRSGGEGLPEEDKLPSPEQTDEERKEQEEELTKKAWETHPEELKKITKIVQEAGFEKVLITTGGLWQIRLRNPDTLFFPKNSLENFREALKFVEEKYLYQGLRIDFSEMKKNFQEPKLEIFRNLVAAQNELKKLEKGIETDEKKLIEKAYKIIILQANIDKLEKELDEDLRSTLSKSEIKEQALRLIIKDILYAGIENSIAVEIVSLKKRKDKEEISPGEYQGQFLEIVFLSSEVIKRLFPNLINKEIIKEFSSEVVITAEQIGGEYVEEKEKEERYDPGIYR